MPFVRERQGGNEWHLARSASTSFAVSLFATPVGIIHEQQATQGSLVVSIFHDLLQFVFHAQGGIGGDPDGSSQMERGDAVF